MIVLDEQLRGRGLDSVIAAWYPGRVCGINHLRPESVIKDDIIPFLLKQQNQTTFITINVTDFWRKVPIDDEFCVICFSFTDSNAKRIPGLLQELLRHPLFQTKS